MKEPRRIYSEGVPSTIEDLNSGSWYYNFDIQSEEIEAPSIKDKDVLEKKTIYNYIQIKLSEKPTYKKCVEMLIREYITQSQEFDLINSANKAILAGNTSNEDITEYKEYLDKVEEIKEKVAKDLGK